MSDHRTITVSFEIDRRGEEQLFFRALHKAGGTWHGPYEIDELTATIAHYVGEDIVEVWLVEREE